MQAKCINDTSEEYPNFKGELSSYKLAGLTNDKLYQVEQSKEYEGYYEVINDLGIKENYKKERFEVMKDKKVRCIRTCGLGHKLTLEKEYSILKEDEDYYYIEPDDGIRDGFQKHLFEEVKEQPISYEEQCKKLQKLLAASEDHNKIFEKENERLKKEKKALENTRDALVKVNNELKEENEELMKTNAFNYDDYKEHLKALQTENKELQVMISDQDRSANELRENIEQEIKGRTIIMDSKENEDLREELQQYKFEIEKYKASEIGYKTIIVNLIEVNKELARNIYVEELED